MGLFSSFNLRSVSLKNRIAVSPMCQYSATDGCANDWHLVHLGSRAVGGAALVMTEATAVDPRGRISLGDLGLWDDAQIEPLARVVRFIEAHGAVAGIQLAHAGRKASVNVPWEHNGAPNPPSTGGFVPIGPSAIAFAEGYQTPDELSEPELTHLVRAFANAARRARAAGFRVVELHAAHGYLLHEFLSPLANRRTDRYGGSFDNRCRLIREVTRALREVWPEELPLFVRLSATDWLPGGWDVDESVALARLLREEGTDLIDCSSGGLAPHARIPAGSGYQVPFSARIRREAGVATAAVGLITDAAQADQIIRNHDADVVLIAREMLRDPYWPMHAAAELRVDVEWPKQYLRAKEP